MADVADWCSFTCNGRPGFTALLVINLTDMIKGQGPGLVNVLSQREWLRVDQFQYTHG